LIWTYRARSFLVLSLSLSLDYTQDQNEQQTISVSIVPPSCREPDVCRVHTHLRDLLVTLDSFPTISKPNGMLLLDILFAFTSSSLGSAGGQGMSRNGVFDCRDCKGVRGFSLDSVGYLLYIRTVDRLDGLVDCGMWIMFFLGW
jgi:hypothetical protein